MTKDHGARGSAQGVGLLAIALVLAMATGSAKQTAPATPAAVVPPRLTDDRLQITLYAQDPDIVTPIGVTVDGKGRLFVVESHTHQPPANYDGPSGDLIKVFEGARPDGRYERMSVFADGLFQAQSLAFSPQGELFVVCTRGLFALHDRDGDGRSEARTRLLTIEPYERRANAHGQMQGIAFSTDGWIYVGRGAHVGGAYTWTAADGTTLPGGPDGGDIIRIRPDGTGLERVATGFWNPFALTIDREGRLISIDNDPDARGPNRLLHIARGGDYGYQTRWGATGLHPYLAWEGDLPGTLPMIYGVGEAPTGVIDAGTARLPAEYANAFLVSVWGEHNLSLYRTRPEGSSLRASREIFLQGQGFDTKTSPFRPSGLATSPDGTIYIADWMLIDYTTHKRGRIWKVTPRAGVATVAPRAPFTPPVPSPAVARLNSLYTMTRPADYSTLRTALTDDDPFVRNAAVTTLARPEFRTAVTRDLEHANERVRLGALLALRKADIPNPETVIKPLLRDPSADVLQMAMIWTGEKAIRSLAPDIDAAASVPGLSKRLFEVWLATMQVLLAPPPAEAAPGAPARGRGEGPPPGQQPASGAGRGTEGSPPGAATGAGRGAGPAGARGGGGGRGRGAAPSILTSDFFGRLVFDDARPVMLRAMALRWLGDIDDPRIHTNLVRMAREGEPSLRTEAVRRLSASARPEGIEALRAIAFDRTAPAALRTEAILSLASKADASLLPLLDDPAPAVRLEAARAFRGVINQPGLREALGKKLSSIANDRANAKLADELRFLTGSEASARPTTVEGWQTLLATGGDADAGRRVFFSAHSACNSCHVAEGRGGVLGSSFSTMPFGPDLSVIARVADRRKLVESIINPSASIAPEMQGWFIQKRSGEMLTGRQIDQANNAIELIMMDGQLHAIPRADVETWGAMGVSLMPPNLHASMAVEEVRDLVAYLESLK